jgi:glutamate formiminotransferase/formiminotetrahydrofolate cyclodeaminase
VKLIECVPNFSEGRDRGIIDAITSEISSTAGAKLLDVDPGAATNRTVVTFAGPPEAVEDAAFRAIRRAAELIDMSRHHGEHPRMGATDVCPFVPMQGATLADCVELARRVGRRVGEELGIPVYLYGAAASRPERRRLPDIREGEYEGLAHKLARPEFAPDFGPAAFHARSGATAIGAREFLIAWNVNLNTRDKRIAARIAAELRETGKPERDARGEIVRDAGGKAVYLPGRFSELQGGGWYIAEYGRAQLTFNVMNPEVAPLHEVFDAALAEAARQGVIVTGSQIVGLVPLGAILAAGDHYLARQGRTTGVPEAERVHTAVLSLGLDDLAPFDPADKILEYRYRGAARGLRAMRLTELADELSSDSPAPGGGSVAALCGALAAALASMVAALTWAKKGLEPSRPAMAELGRKAQALKDWFLDAVDRDAAAFDAVIAARRRPRGTDREQAERSAAIDRANESATRVPLEVLARSVETLELALAAARDGNPASVSDAGVAGACGLAAAEGAALNVRINLPSVADPAVAAAFASEQEALLRRARAVAGHVRDTVEEVLSPPPRKPPAAP